MIKPNSGKKDASTVHLLFNRWGLGRVLMIQYGLTRGQSFLLIFSGGSRGGRSRACLPPPPRLWSQKHISAEIWSRMRHLRP